MVVRPLIYQFEPKNKKIIKLWENWNQDWKMQHFSAFIIRARPEVGLQEVKFGSLNEGHSWFSPDSVQKLGENGVSVAFSVSSRSYGDLGHFKGPELPVGQFSIRKKHFFINTNNFKSFLLQQRKTHGF
jgi:hypothetical protein